MESTTGHGRVAQPAPRTARARVRAEITAQIKAHARDQLAADGASALSLRAIARDMGLASSALFRYFPSRDALLTALIIDSYGSLADATEAAEAGVRPGSALDRWLAICHGVRDWALAHPHEYALIFGSPVPGYAAPQDTLGPALRVPMLLTSLLEHLLATGGYDPDAHPAIPEDVTRALAPLLATVPPGVPPDLVVRGLMAWTYLLGAVSSELFGHRYDVVDRCDTFFDHEIRRIAEVLGLAG
jgi:AcrR family transcriptional regulator